MVIVVVVVVALMDYDGSGVGGDLSTGLYPSDDVDPVLDKGGD